MGGKTRRLGRIFNCETGRAVLAPIDHGIWSGPVQGIENPKKVLAAVLAGGADAVLLNPGFVRDAGDLIPPGTGLIVRVSTGTELVAGADQEYVFASIERALRVGGDAVAVTVYPTGSGAQSALSDLGRVIDAAERYDVPVLAEFLPLGDADWELVAHMARIGYEMGADIVKTSYTGDAESFHRVVERCPTPIIVAGGDPAGKPEDVVTMAYQAVTAGAAGTAIGRNTWQNNDPEKMVAGIAAAVHGHDLNTAKGHVSQVHFL